MLFKLVSEYEIEALPKPYNTRIMGVAVSNADLMLEDNLPLAATLGFYPVTQTEPPEGSEGQEPRKTYTLEGDVIVEGWEAFPPPEEE